MTEPNQDPTVRRLRDEISGLDRSILEAVNARVRLVAQLKAHKAENGLPFVDPDRERELIEALTRANGGPLSEDGVRELYTSLLELTKREVTRDGDQAG